MSALGEMLTRVTLRMSDIRLFTSRAYLGELMPPGAPRAYVTPATWLNEEWILGDEEAAAAWAAKQGPVRLVYAGRLVSPKGVSVLLAAIRAAAEAGTDTAFVDPSDRGQRLAPRVRRRPRTSPARPP